MTVIIVIAVVIVVIIVIVIIRLIVILAHYVLLSWSLVVLVYLITHCSTLSINVQRVLPVFTAQVFVIRCYVHLVMFTGSMLLVLPPLPPSRMLMASSILCYVLLLLLLPKKHLLLLRGQTVEILWLIRRICKRSVVIPIRMVIARILPRPLLVLTCRIRTTAMMPSVALAAVTHLLVAAALVASLRLPDLLLTIMELVANAVVVLARVDDLL